MEPLLIVLVPGVLGGTVLAALIATKRLNFRAGGADRPLPAPSPSLINMARIPVEGGGGLGIVAAVIAVALADPRIRVAVGIAALLGILMAAILIARRRDRPTGFGGDDSGHQSLLGLDRDGPAVGRAVSSDGQRRPPDGRAGRSGLRWAAGH